MSKKTYRLEVTDTDTINDIEEMLKDYIAMGKNLVDAIRDAAIHHNKTKKKKVRLVTEQELLSISKEMGLTQAKSSLVQYRRKGVLKDKDGAWFFQNQQNRVVYNLDKMLEFLKQRKQSPKSRLLGENNVKPVTKQTITEQ